jgi:hypothetical protein
MFPTEHQIDPNPLHSAALRYILYLGDWHRGNGALEKGWIVFRSGFRGHEGHRHTQTITPLSPRWGKTSKEISTVPESSIMSAVHFTIDWIQARLRERTSWDGFTIIIISLMILVASPLVRYAAWAGLIYGAWTLWRKEKWNPLSSKAGFPDNLTK